MFAGQINKLTVCSMRTFGQARIIGLTSSRRRAFFKEQTIVKTGAQHVTRLVFIERQILLPSTSVADGRQANASHERLMDRSERRVDSGVVGPEVGREKEGRLGKRNLGVRVLFESTITHGR
ncbi:hypothetical protein BIW11_04127 [Tropilaelaps mercedesae]|uniref:Uncharacterized protein n=1 Tax=Tropilaelaps mercedesae TaxID=418985 RepID=A0A1V9XAL8_9ACAR|nr:hypothetical protein BIW11_04127 [Tropilaelaps mercedesae]